MVSGRSAGFCTLSAQDRQSKERAAAGACRHRPPGVPLGPQSAASASGRCCSSGIHRDPEGSPLESSPRERRLGIHTRGVTRLGIHTQGWPAGNSHPGIAGCQNVREVIPARQKSAEGTANSSYRICGVSYSTAIPHLLETRRGGAAASASAEERPGRFS